MGVAAILFAGASPAPAEDMLIWNDQGEKAIVTMPIDGSAQPTPLNVAPAVVGDHAAEVQASLDYDPESGRLYWSNFANPAGIYWANIDGSGGGTVVGPTDLGILDLPQGISFDGGTDRLFVNGYDGHLIGSSSLGGTVENWPPGASPEAWGGPLVYPVQEYPLPRGVFYTDFNQDVFFGKLDGSSDNFKLHSTPNSRMNGALAVDFSHRLVGSIYPGNPQEEQTIRWKSLETAAGGPIQITNDTVHGVSAIASDEISVEMLWMNAAPGAPNGQTGIFRAFSAGPAAGYEIGDAEIGGWSGGLLILRKPVPTGRLDLTGDTTTGSVLTCGQATWWPDSPESHFFIAPNSTGVEWSLNGERIEGATGQTHATDLPGTYKCFRTGSNPAGKAEAESNEVVVTDPPPPPPFCPPGKIAIGLSRFKPVKPYGRGTTLGVRVTFRTNGDAMVSVRPRIVFRGKEGTRVGQLRRHEFRVFSRQRIRFVLPEKLERAIARERGGVRLAPVTLEARASVWRPGKRKCAQSTDLEMETRVWFVSDRVGLRGLR